MLQVCAVGLCAVWVYLLCGCTSCPCMGRIPRWRTRPLLGLLVLCSLSCLCLVQLQLPCLTLLCLNSLPAPAAPCPLQADVANRCRCASHALCLTVGHRCDAAESQCRDGCCFLGGLCCRRGVVWLPVRDMAAGVGGMSPAGSRRPLQVLRSDATISSWAGNVWCCLA